MSNIDEHTWKFTARVSEEVKGKLEALAERRYGDRSQESLSLLVEDTLRWKLDSWDRAGISLGDWFWLQLAYRGPIPQLRNFAWGKLIEGYFE